MAEYSINSLVNPSAQKEVEKLLESLQKSSDIAKNISLASSNAKDINESLIAQEKLTKAQKESELALKKIDALNQKIAIDAQKEIDRKIAQQDKANKAELRELEKQQKAQEKLTKEAEKQVAIKNKKITALKEATPGSIDKLSAANSILNEKLRAVNQTTEAGAQKAERLRGAIDRNQKKIVDMGTSADKQRANIGNYGSVWDRIGGTFSKVGGIFMGFTALFGAGSIIVAGFNKTLGALDSSMDAFIAMQEGATQATNAFFLSIAEGDWSNLIDKMVDAYNEGKRYAEMLDLLEDKNRALNITNAQTDSEISRLKAFARDRTNDLASRKEAIDKIMALERKKLEDTKAIRDQEAGNELENASKISNLSQEAIKQMISTIGFQEKMNEALAIEKRLRDNSYEYVQGRDGARYRVFSQEKYNKLLAQETGEIQRNIYFSTRYNRIPAEKRALIEKALIGQYNAEKEYTDGIGGLAKLRNSLENELLKDGEDRANARIKQIEKVSKAMQDQLAYELKINQFRQNDLSELIENEKFTYDERIKSLDDFMQAQEEALLLQFEFDMENAKSNTEKLRLETIFGKEMNNISKNYNKKKTEIVLSETEKQIKLQKDQFTQISDLEAQRLIKLDILKNKELELNAVAYANGVISKEEYEKEKQRIEVEYSGQSIDLQIKTAEKQLEFLKSLTDLTEEQKKQIIDIEKQISDYKIQKAEESAKNQEQLDEERIERLKKYASQAKEILGGINSITDAYFSNELTRLDEKSKADEIAKQRELDSAGDNTRKKEQIEKKYAEKQKKIQRERDEIAYKQALSEKAQKIAMMTIEIAMLLVEQKYVEAAVAGVALASAIATKIPKPANYFKGTNYHPGGKAWIAEKGREIVEMDSKRYLADSKMLVDLPRGAKVYTNYETEKILKNESVSLVNFDVLVNEQAKTNKYLSHIAKNGQKSVIFVDNSRRNHYKYN